MKRLLMLTAAMMIAVSAHASSGANQFGSPYNLTFRAGLAFSFDDSTRDVAGTLFGLGLDYYLEGSLLGREGDSYVSFDWIQGTKSGSNVQMFPLMINQKWYGEPRNIDGSQRTYWFLGAGIAFIGNNDTVTTFAARGGVGMELSDTLLVEGTVLFGTAARGVRSNSIGVYLGYRF